MMTITFRQICMVHEAQPLTRLSRATALRCLVASLLPLMLCSGCDRGRPPVYGEVTFDGKPVEDGTITFEPADGQGPATGGKIAAGRYEVTGDAAPLPGKKIVRIFAVRKTGRRVTDRLMGTVDEVEPYIPDIYNQRTTLVREVSKDGAQQIDFKLKSK